MPIAIDDRSNEAVFSINHKSQKLAHLAVWFCHLLFGVNVENSYYAFYTRISFTLDRRSTR
jgi:hypothetical protein